MTAPCVFPILPSEIWIEILSRLPWKTLMQFTCVSKSWKSLITKDPTFAKLRLKKSPKSTHILLTFEDDVDYEHQVTSFISCSVSRLLREPSSMIDEDKCYIFKGNNFVIGSCNGLVCLAKFYDAGQIVDFWVRLWNPTTHLSSEKSPTFQMNSRVMEFASGDTMNCGFGYDDSRDTYKVVVVLWDCTKRNMETWVHCMTDSCWRKILSKPNSSLLLQQIDGQFVGGCVNWLALDKVNGPKYQWDNVTLQHLVILSFDMHKEVYRYMSLPEGISQVPYAEPYLGVLGNHMCLFHDHDKTHFVVWQMKEYGVQDSWTRLVNVSYEHIHGDGFQFLPLPIFVSEDDDFIFLAYNDEVVIYNLKDNSVKHIQLPKKKYLLSVDGYVQSPISPCRD